MRREEITERLAQIEDAYPVDEYTAYDWHVWPLLRIVLSFELVNPSKSRSRKRFDCLRRRLNDENAPRLMRSSWHRIRPTTRRLRQFIQSRKNLKLSLSKDSAHDDPPDAPDRDVVTLVTSGRRIRKDDCWYEIYSDPLIENLEAMGISSLVWELGREYYPRYSKSVWISHRLALESARHGQWKPLGEPTWFQDYARFTAPLLGRKPTWDETESHISNCERHNRVYSKWLSRVRPKLLFVVCWYEAYVMAATLAARRRGIRICDLQHGIQGSGHFAYSSWTKAPDCGYEAVPDCFWTWGKESTDDIIKSNPGLRGHCSVIEGGNPWLDKWRRNDDASIREERDKAGALAAAHEKRILVTLQKGVDFSGPVLSAVEQSPREWLWLIRFHRGSTPNECEQIQCQFRQTGHPGVEFRHANDLGLYALLGVSNVNITGFSTCALEALAFGVPTVTVHKSGRIAFQNHLKAGVMFFASSGPDVLESIHACQYLDATECKRAGEAIFADAGVCSSALDQLLSREVL